MRVHGALLVLSMVGTSAQASMGAEAAWTRVGPEGGDVRSLALDPGNPGRVYLGASDGGLYRSDSGGDRWERLSPGFPRRGQNLDEIVVSPLGHLIIGFWDVHGRGGGVAVSLDFGLTFTISLEGESVRALSLSPSNPKFVVAGTLGGVFTSSDGGFRWQRITPEGHAELRNVESVAVDPRNTRVIYAGTRHLPWKTTNRGVTWRSVPRGMIDDSDVFTLTVDQRDPQHIHATACSGIYGSRNGGATWSRVRGIPDGSRRTRAFAQDRSRPATFYAGTTQGLWVSDDDAARWRLVTPRDLVINALLVLPDGSVLAGADGAGVLRSHDGGSSWRPANGGFSEQFVSRVVFDTGASRVLAGVWGDRDHGGVFSAATPRGPWTRAGHGLKGREVVSLAVAGPKVLAGTDQGLFALNPLDSVWRRVTLRGIRPGDEPGVHDLAVQGAIVLAGASTGLYRSEDGATSFEPALTDVGEVTALAFAGRGALTLAATSAGLHMSRDEGRTWTLAPWPARGVRVNALLTFEEDDVVLAASSGGLYRSADGGASFVLGGRGLPDSDFTSLASTPNGEVLFTSDFTWGGLYRSDDHGRSWTRLDATGLVTDRIWTMAMNPAEPGDLIVAASSGGLHAAASLAPRRPHVWCRTEQTPP